MVALLLSNLLLVRQAALYQFFLAAQVFAYTLAVGGTVWSRASRWKAAKIASTFLLLNWFVVLGLAEFLRNRNAHLWKSKKMASSKKA
jgi:hypothetical protein